MGVLADTQVIGAMVGLADAKQKDLYVLIHRMRRRMMMLMMLQ